MVPSLCQWQVTDCSLVPVPCCLSRFTVGRSFEKLALNSGTPGGARKRRKMRLKHPSSHPTCRKQTVSVQTGMSTISGDELILRHLQLRDCVTACSQGRPQLVDKLRKQTGTKGTSTTGSKVLQLRDLRGFLASEPCGSCRCTQRACEQQCPASTAATVGSRPSLTACTRKIAGLAQQGHRTPDQWAATGEPQWSADWTTGNDLCATKGKSTSLTGRVNNQSGNAQCALCVPVSEQNGKIHHSVEELKRRTIRCPAKTAGTCHAWSQ